MKLHKRLILVFSVVLISLFGISQTAIADTTVSGEELKTLLSGNTVEGKYLKWDTTHKMYFEATGKIRRIDSLNNKQSGDWYIDSNDLLCISMKRERCNEVTKRDDGGYNVSRKGSVKFTFDKILPGNPHGL